MTALVFFALALLAVGCTRRGRRTPLVDTGTVTRDGGGPDIGSPPPDGGRCAAGLTNCGGACVDVLGSDSNHCGACFRTCPMGACSGGMCLSVPDSGPPADSGACGVGEAPCGGGCASLSSDPGNCGTCGNACGLGSACAAGLCGGSVAVGDRCATGGAPLPAGGGGVSFMLTGRLIDHSPFSCGTSTARPDAALRWVPARSGMARIHAHGPTPSTDTVLAVFSSSTCTSATEVACNDDYAGGTVDSRLDLPVTGGTSYYIVVSPFGGTTPTVPITVEISFL